jgi:hypothetical protein
VDALVDPAGRGRARDELADVARGPGVEPDALLHALLARLGGA